MVIIASLVIFGLTAVATHTVTESILNKQDSTEAYGLELMEDEWRSN